MCTYPPGKQGENEKTPWVFQGLQKKKRWIQSLRTLQKQVRCVENFELWRASYLAGSYNHPRGTLSTPGFYSGTNNSQM